MKKLDQKGWGLQELLVGLSILFFFLFLIVSLINRNFKQLESMMESDANQNRPTVETKFYEEIELKMIQATKNYQNDHYGNKLQEGDQITITLKTLTQNDYINEIKDEKGICSGYVTFIKERNKVSYSPYLKCGNHYITKGYLERLDAKFE